MSRRKPSISDALVMLPWQVSATIAAVSFICLRWIVPSIAFDHTFLKVFAKASTGYSWAALIVFGLFSCVSAAFASKKRYLLDRQRDLESLRALTWQEFEWMVGEAYRRQGYSVEESIAVGSDGGIDLILRKDRQASLVQCKRWKTQSVGAPVIREMFGLLTHHRADQVIVVTSGHFTREAISFAQDKPIVLIDGPELLTLIQSVQDAPVASKSEVSRPPASSEATSALDNAKIVDSGACPLPCFSSENICPICGASMVKRTAKRGANAGNEFWGCSNYPSCRGVRDA